MPDLGKREEKKNKRYKSIVTTAEKLFLSAGLDHVQMQDIADAEQIGIATLFRYFPKKDRLLVAVAVNNLEAHIQSFTDIAYNQETAFIRLEKVLDLLTVESSGTLSQAAAFREAFESYASFAQEPLDTIDEYIATQEKIAELVMKIIEDGKKDGSFRQNIPIKEAIIATINSYGTFGSNITLKSSITFLEEDIAPHKQQQMLKEMLLTYLRP
ncbi:TetR/AcrR family transcriptional regulator [Bacillus sp. JCM 19041]|uniref:TetR/AcrR family transcriptional regulator n=1 Tax=Bacillus sp. JCM 19041 TaxID=1460637 RepID=UPI0006D03749